MSTDKTTWKNFERKVAEFFGGSRTPLSGMCGNLTKSDIIHEDFFVECKYRQSFSVFEKFQDAQELLNKKYKSYTSRGEQITYKPLVYKITNFVKYKGGDLWLFDPEDLPQIMGSAEKVEDTNGVPRLIILSNKVELVKAKADTIAVLYQDICPKAAKENKVPIVAIKMKNRRGWLMAVNPVYLSKIRKLSKTIV